MYSSSQGVNYYAIHSLLYLRIIQEKYIKMYERFVNQLKEYLQAIRILSKGYLPISLLPPSKLAKILQEVKQVLLKTNKNYGLVIKGMYKYYDMKLVKWKMKAMPSLYTRPGTSKSRPIIIKDEADPISPNPMPEIPRSKIPPPYLIPQSRPPLKPPDQLMKRLEVDDSKTDIEEKSPFQENIISEIYERPNKSYFQELVELKDLVDTNNIIQ